MKKRFIFVICMISHALIAQTLPQRYVLVEHVTNSRCSVCKSKNPAMYSLLEQHPTEVHHLAYHPSFPYSNCVFYQANTTENNARAAYYDISSTPKVILNGTLAGATPQLLPAATLNAALNQTASVYLKVTETPTEVRVKVYNSGVEQSGNFLLYTAFAEKTVNYAAPNGETVHRDVFRDMLSNINGDPITLPISGLAAEVVYPKPTNSAWNTNEMYAIAWVQNSQTKEVLNSGTRFDASPSGTADLPSSVLSISPNPATETIYTTVTEDTPQAVAVYAMDGALVRANWVANSNRVDIDVADLTAGIYFIQIRGEKATFTGKFVKI